MVCLVSWLTRGTGTPVIVSTGERAGDQRGQRILYGGKAAQYCASVDVKRSSTAVIKIVNVKIINIRNEDFFS
jgi:hypothetical protein